MAYHGKGMKAKSPGGEGMQKKKAGSDCGAHTAFFAAAAPKSVKAMAEGKTPYKHR